MQLYRAVSRLLSAVALPCPFTSFPHLTPVWPQPLCLTPVAGAERYGSNDFVCRLNYMRTRLPLPLQQMVAAGVGAPVPHVLLNEQDEWRGRRRRRWRVTGSKTAYKTSRTPSQSVAEHRVSHARKWQQRQVKQKQKQNQPETKLKTEKIQRQNQLKLLQNAGTLHFCTLHFSARWLNKT